MPTDQLVKSITGLSRSVHSRRVGARNAQQEHPIQVNVQITGERLDDWRAIQSYFKEHYQESGYSKPLSSAEILKEAIDLLALTIDQAVQGKDIRSEYDGEEISMNEYFNIVPIPGRQDKEKKVVSAQIKRDRKNKYI